MSDTEVGILFQRNRSKRLRILRKVECLKPFDCGSDTVTTQRGKYVFFIASIPPSSPLENLFTISHVVFCTSPLLSATVLIQSECVVVVHSLLLAVLIRQKCLEGYFDKAMGPA